MAEMSRSDRFFETLKQPMRPGTPTRPRLFGILNLTPDSFSDGGAHTASPETAADFAAQMVTDGADALDLRLFLQNPRQRVAKRACAGHLNVAVAVLLAGPELRADRYAVLAADALGDCADAASELLHGRLDVLDELLLGERHFGHTCCRRRSRR